MNDLDICRRIAKIDGVNYTVCINAKLYPPRDAIYFREYYGNRPAPTESKKLKEYNPLTDDALCFHLMVKYKLSLFAPLTEQTNWDCVISDIFTCDENPNKAICLAIIEANKGLNNE